MDNKLNNVSIEELLNSLAQHPSQEDNIVIDDPIFIFVQTFNIKAGENRVTTKLLVQLFKEWSRSNITQIKFTMEFSKYFIKESVKNTSYFSLDKSTKDLVVQLDRYKNPQKLINIPSKGIKSNGVQKHFEKFMDECNIKSGDLYVEADIFYHVYDTWCYKNKLKSLSYIRFVTICSLIFDYKKLSNDNARWFGLDASIKQQINPTAVSNWRSGRKFGDKKEKYIQNRKSRRQKTLYPKAED